MIDGPHRSLPLKRHWKNFALRADKEAHSLEERLQSLSVAVKKEFSNSALATVRNILHQIDRGFPDIVDPIEQIEAIREDCSGSTTDNSLINCVIFELSKKNTGQKVLKDALKSASEEVVHAHLRSIEEHYCRDKEGMNTIDSLRNRIDETVQKIDFDSIVSELIEGLGSKKSVQNISKHVGIDEGPKL